jgi:hypothetical protein
MKKSPELNVIGAAPRPDPLQPPPELGEHGTALWNRLHHDFEITDASGLEMLVQICCTADRVAEYSAAIERDGAVLRVKGGGLRDHPLIRHVQTGRSFIVRSLHKLGLDVVEPRSGPGRPAGDYR